MHHLEVVLHGGVLARRDVLRLGENVPTLGHLVRVVVVVVMVVVVVVVVRARVRVVPWATSPGSRRCCAGESILPKDIESTACDMLSMPCCKE